MHGTMNLKFGVNFFIIDRS